MEDIHQGWLDISASKTSSRGWLKKTITKPWKKKYFVLRRDEQNRDKILLMAFDKEDNISKQKPKKVLDLFPKYQVAKRTGLKGREFAFQISTETENWFLAAKNQKILDLWVIQIQMQTKLSYSITGPAFNVKAANTKQQQRIGAKDQPCLLHFSKWGLTLALQESRAVLALWPLDTIRNYECTGTCQFIFEAGRRCPMGEGKYAFFTYEGEDEKMFNAIDAFVSARLAAKADLTPAGSRPEVTDDDIVLAYDKLHSSILGELTNDAFEDNADYSRLSHQGSSKPMAVSFDRPPSYDHLTRMGDIRPMPDDLDSCPPSSYDQLNRTGSWGYKAMVDEAGYNFIDRPDRGPSHNYDHLDQCTADQAAQRPGHFARLPSADSEPGKSFGAWPLSRHEPSVPNLPERSHNPNDDSFLSERCDSLSSATDQMACLSTSSPPDQDAFQSQQNSTGGRKQRRTTGERTALSSSLQDEPPPLPSPRAKSSNVNGPVISKPVPKPGDVLVKRSLSNQESEYQNT